ncbi:hypothetical protein [Nodularia sp. UHCC 0506]|uniref:hypothetical protein n=1 Tax=Nodularia sp. UHCC 0506 TaxID=3110243 RepID=UPI002B1EA7D3|nr:hypothetical protein [Nodularia sp. UHCC 0506]MEA5514006.1 hypothetical protein [Nodularia sp. UHCC 0506]
MSVVENSILAFIQVLHSQSKLIPTQDWNELQELWNQFPEDDEEITEIIENWLQTESRSQLLETYKQNLKSLTAAYPIDAVTNIGIGNSKSTTPPDQPSPSSKELLENAIKNNSPLSDEKQSQQKP